MSIFVIMFSNDMFFSSYERDRLNFGYYVNFIKWIWYRVEKSISGMSYFSRGMEDFSGFVSFVSY